MNVHEETCMISFIGYAIVTYHGYEYRTIKGPYRNIDICLHARCNFILIIYYFTIILAKPDCKFQTNNKYCYHQFEIR